MENTDAARMIVLFESAAKTTYDGAPKLWDEVLAALNLDIRYQPTVAEVLQRSTWRTAANPRAYVATAAVRSARGKKLPDYFEKEFHRVAAGHPNDDVGTAIDSAAGFKLDDWGEGGYERTATGAIRQVGDYYDDHRREIPGWLQRENESDAVDWETVAAYAVLKPRMACELARVLIMRLELRVGRPEAISSAANPQEAGQIEAAWKWIDRNNQERIAPLFKLAAPPGTLTAAEIASFPMLVPGVSLRIDIHSHWDGKGLILMRTGLTPDEEGAVPAFYLEAASEDSARDMLRLAASKGERSEMFHFWKIESAPPAANQSAQPKQGAFPKPWEVLSQVRNRSGSL